MPVIEFAPAGVHLAIDRHARPIKDKADNLKLCDVLDAIMAERRAGTYPREGVSGTSPRVVPERMTVEAGDGQWSPPQWSDIAFSDWDISLEYYQGCIDNARRALAG